MYLWHPQLLKMIKYFLLLVSLSALTILSCKDSGSNGDKEASTEKSLPDSLEDQVWDGHDVGMAKYGKLRSMKLRAEQMIDSISKLPAQAKEKAANLREQLDSLVVQLTNAKEGMDQWMSYYRGVRDSAKDDAEKRIAFLRDEIVRVNKVRDAILASLAKADSLVK
jgi:hypothetical protein